MAYDLDSLTVKEIEKELSRVRYKLTYRKILRSTFFSLVVVAAVAILIATLFLPVLNIYGMSMAPTLEDGDIVACVKSGDFQAGSTVAFYYNNKILVKRVIASSGQWVDMDENGNVFVDNVPLIEPYLTEKAYGECNIELPYQVPDGRYFVMGDNRAVSADSRVSEIGCIAQEAIIGEIVFRVWPWETIGSINPTS